jgi:hypothetical protein
MEQRKREIRTEETKERVEKRTRGMERREREKSTLQWDVPILSNPPIGQQVESSVEMFLNLQVCLSIHLPLSLGHQVTAILVHHPQGNPQLFREEGEGVIADPRDKHGPHPNAGTQREIVSYSTPQFPLGLQNPHL